VIRDQTGGIAASGAQGFPGYTPATEVDDGRHNIALYLDAEHNLTDSCCWPARSAARNTRTSAAPPPAS
jgi:hypothetical protein